MKRMDFFARQGADPQSYGVYGKGLQRRMAKKTPFHVLLFPVRDTSSLCGVLTARYSFPVDYLHEALAGDDFR